MLFDAKWRLGFPRVGSRLFLTGSLHRADPGAHRYENWRTLGRALGFELPHWEQLPCSVRHVIRTSAEVTFSYIQERANLFAFGRWNDTGN